MKLKDLIAYLERRFPAKAEVLDIQISMIADKRIGLVETVTMLDDDDCDDPDDTESQTEPTQANSHGLRLIS
jgi:hypothetical protein